MSFNPPPLPPVQPPWPQFQVWWQQVVESLKSELGALETAETALAAAVAAQSTADAANTTATRAKKNDAVSASWTSPGSILSANDGGSSATIVVANHARKYGDTSSVSVTGDTLAGLSYSTLYSVYYDDDNHAGGAVTYHATTNPNTALPNAATGRHFCGTVTTPPSGGTTTSGGYTPPGGNYTGPGQIP